jgi:hypothetical protein
LRFLAPFLAATGDPFLFDTVFPLAILSCGCFILFYFLFFSSFYPLLFFSSLAQRMFICVYFCGLKTVAIR